jgi:hypothetical protein
VRSPEDIQNELAQRHRCAVLVVAGFLVLTLALVGIAVRAAAAIQRPGDPTLPMILWITILVFGLGALVLRRTRFAATRLKDIAAVQGDSALLKTLQGTTIQVASIGGAIALMGFIITIRTGLWFDMLRAGGVAVIILIYCYPSRRAWQRTVAMLASEP